MNLRTYVIAVVATFVVLTGLHALGVQSVRLACWSGGYKRDAWMAYCNSDRYGVYDVDAVWFDTEGEVGAAIKHAQILTLSDSRLQNALSLGGAPAWFAERGYETYLLGLPTEESGFAEKLWDKYQPHPAVVIFDASPYFTGNVGGSELALSQQPEHEHEEAMKLHRFESFHREFCSRFDWFCGHTFSYFRSRHDGHWIFPSQTDPVWFGRGGMPNDQTRLLTDVLPDELVPLYPDYLKAARRLLAKINLPPQCVVLTHVPHEERADGLPRYLAESLGVVLLDPKVPNLYTFDRAHLTPESSLAWTAQFLKQLDPILKKCIALPGHTPQTLAANPVAWLGEHP